MDMPVGSILWMDLTVDNADTVRDFYQAVVGWKVEGCPMGDYQDYVMQQPADGKGVSGVCHARGANATQPPVWMIYITVADLDASIAQALALGGKLIVPIRSMGGTARFCVIQDPAGAMAGLYQP